MTVEKCHFVLSIILGAILFFSGIRCTMDNFNKQETLAPI